MASYLYRKSHCGDKMVQRLFYLHHGISYSGKMTSLYWIRALGAVSIERCHLISIGIPMLKIRWSHDRPIFDMGIPIPGKDGLYIETDPRSLLSHPINDLLLCSTNPSLKNQLTHHQSVHYRNWYWHYKLNSSIFDHQSYFNTDFFTILSHQSQRQGVNKSFLWVTSLHPNYSTY